MGKITVVGVGLEIGDLTFAAADALSAQAKLILHTEQIGCADYLKEKKIPYETLDRLYETCEDFDQHAAMAADYVIARAAEADVVYAVYDVRDVSVLKLSERVSKLRVIAGPPVESALLARLDGATRMLEASDWENFSLSAADNALIREINKRELASEIKLKLMECYPDETRVFFLSEGGEVSRIPLYDLDRMKRYDHRSCALIPAQRNLMELERYGFDDLVRIMRILQGPDGCPWDMAQTHESLRRFMLEETYEVIDAINQGDPDHLYDELGDMLMQVVMQAEIGRRHGEFDISDCITAICRKMIERHTHIFGNDHVEDAAEVLDLWTKNKMKERGQQSFSEVLCEVSRGFPALMRCAKILEKSTRAGVAPTDTDALKADAKAKIEAISKDTAQESIGNALFSLCALARNMKIDPEIALNEAADRYIRRFEALEKSLADQGKHMPLPAEEAAKYWELVKL